MFSIITVAVINLFLAFIIGRPVIKALTKLKSIQSFRSQGPQSHIETKAGTPTMGGIIFLLPILCSSLAIAFISQSKIAILVAFAFLAGALIGGIDDLLKVLKANYRGINSFVKLIAQFTASSLIVYFSGRYLFPSFNINDTSLIPVIIEFIWAFFVIAGTTNAINLSDGLDGLATMLSIIAFGSMGYFLWLQGDTYTVYLCIAIVFALFGFLIFNFKPAKVFMGDIGSLALGMGLGTLAYVTNSEWYLLIFAFMPVIETLSVMLQVSSAILSRKFLNKDIRIFKMAPLHHHFELIGFNEIIIVLGFSLIGLSLVIGFFILNPPLPTLVW